jgi:hypothetical protein
MKHAMAREELKIEFRGEDEAVINDEVTIRSKPLVTYLKHALKFYLGPHGGEVTVTRDYYDERVASYIISRDGEETSVYISDTGVEVDGTEVKNELLASLIKRALDAYFLTNGEAEMEVVETKPGAYRIRAKTLGG